MQNAADLSTFGTILQELAKNELFINPSHGCRQAISTEELAYNAHDLQNHRSPAHSLHLRELVKTAQ